jgi:PAS domain S-box-containing protein
VAVGPDPRVVRRLRQLSLAGAAVAASVGALVLAGWALPLSALTGLRAEVTAMKPNTALALVLVGAAIALHYRRPMHAARRRMARGLGAAAALIGALTLLEDAIHADLGIDELVFGGGARARLRVVGQMSPLTAASLAGLGGAVALLGVRLGRAARSPSQWLALATLLVSLLPMLGYLYGVEALHRVGPQTSVALHTALAILIASCATLFACPESGGMRVVASDSPAGAMARRLLPAAFLVPALLGWLRLKGQEAGYYGSDFGVAILAFSNVVCFTGLVLWSAWHLFKSDDARNEAEARLRESEEDVRITLQSIGDAVVATDTSGRLTRMNKAAERLTGWTAAEGRGRPWGDVFRIVNEETREPVVGLVERLIERGQGLTLANHSALVGREGKERPIADSGAPIRDAQGRMRGVVLVFQDRSLQREAERDLRESEARSAAVIAGALDCIITMDDRGRITEFNPAAEKTFGHSRAEAIDQVLADLIIPPALREAHRAGLAKYLQTGEGPLLGKRVEIAAMRADGSEFPVELFIAPSIVRGRRTFTGFLRDLSERKQAEAAIEKLRGDRERDLTASVQARDDFIGVAGHELKTPVATLVMQMQNLQRIIAADPTVTVSANVRQGLQKATRSALRLNRLVMRLLDVSRITAGRLRLEPETVELTEVVREVVERFQEAQPGRPIHLESEPRVCGQWDRLRVEEVIDNLVGNAIKYGEGKPVEVDLHREGDRAVLRVVDHGIGIDEEHQRKLFQRFERAVSGPQFRGMGLGLWISRQIVDASGGEIGVESSLGRGSKFTVRLPMGQ